MSTEERPDIDKFMSDPKFQKDRDFFDALIGKTLERRAAEAQAKPQPDQASIWDRLFWRPKADADGNIFDVFFGGRK